MSTRGILGIQKYLLNIQTIIYNKHNILINKYNINFHLVISTSVYCLYIFVSSEYAIIAGY